ncbi:MAG: lamin tail domain-containing protein [Bacteroidales bacterium]|nr:lamin tail domain-containing protein [Bacteroidales bacterium]
MKKIILALVALSVVFVACLKNDPPASTLSVQDVEMSNPLPGSDENVTITVVVKEVKHTITSVVIEWKKDEIAQTSITMTAGANDTYTGTIPGQPDGTTVTFTIKATNSDGKTETSALNTIMWVDELPWFMYVKLNEVSGVGGDPDKFYELINIGTEPIDLHNFTIHYNANGAVSGSFPPNDNRLTWTGCEAQIIQPGELLTLLGRDTPCSFGTGLTAARILVITLSAPNGTVVDQCIRTKDQGEYTITDKSYSRIPDGTGTFYFTTPSPNVMNGNDATGLTEVPSTP